MFDFGRGNSLDYGARFYDASVVRFMGVDPMAEIYDFQTPYAYSANNPVSNIDILGMAAASTTELINTVWERGNGTYDNEGNRIEDDNKSEASNDEDDCCGPDLFTIRQAAKVSGLDMNTQSSILWAQGEGASELSYHMVKEATFIYVGGKAFQLLFRGGKWVLVAYRTSQSNKVASATANSLKAIDKLDELILFRDLTGSEGSGATIFFTDNAAVAASYVKNGGTVAEVTISKVQAQKLMFANKLKTLTGIHGPTGAISTEYKFIGAELKQAIMSMVK